MTDGDSRRFGSDTGMPAAGEAAGLAKPLAFIGIGPAERALAQLLWRMVEPHADAIIDEFYQRVGAAKITPHVNERALGRLKTRQKEHWAALFGSAFDENYANSVRRIGIRHRDIALDPLWHIAGYMVLKIEMVKIIVSSPLTPHEKGHLVKTLDKYVAIDMGLALSTYNASILD